MRGYSPKTNNPNVAKYFVEKNAHAKIVHGIMPFMALLRIA